MKRMPRALSILFLSMLLVSIDLSACSLIKLATAAGFATAWVLDGTGKVILNSTLPAQHHGSPLSKAMADAVTCCNDIARDPAIASFLRYDSVEVVHTLIYVTQKHGELLNALYGDMVNDDGSSKPSSLSFLISKLPIFNDLHAWFKVIRSEYERYQRCNKAFDTIQHRTPSMHDSEAIEIYNQVSTNYQTKLEMLEAVFVKQLERFGLVMLF
jgi:hypothetical protein